MIDVIREIAKSIEFYCGPGWYWLLWLAALVWLWWRKGRGPYRDLLLVFIIIAVAVCNPLTGAILLRLLDNSYQVYSRVYWLLMIEPFIAACAAELLGMLETGAAADELSLDGEVSGEGIAGAAGHRRAALRKAGRKKAAQGKAGLRKHGRNDGASGGPEVESAGTAVVGWRPKPIVAGLLVVALMASGAWIYDKDTVYFMDNRMEISGTAIAAAEYILQNREKKKDKTVAGELIVSQLRQFDGTIRMHYGRRHEKKIEYYLEIGGQELKDILAHYRKRKVKYLIIKEDELFTKRLAAFGWKKVETIGDHAVYIPTENKK